MKRSWLVVVVALVACDEPLVLGRNKVSGTKRTDVPRPTGTSPAGTSPVGTRPTPPPAPNGAEPGGVAVMPVPPEPPPPVATRPIEVFDVEDGMGRSPMKIVVAAGTLAWTDSAGSLWTMPAKGGERPTELSNQHMEGRPMFGNLTKVGDVLVGVTDTQLWRIGLPRGPLTLIKDFSDDDWVVDLVSDGTAVFGTRMQSDAIFRVEPDGTHTTVASLKRAGLAVRGDTLYASSYARGTIIAVKTTGGKPRTIAKGLRHPTGFAVDDTAAYAWCESDSAVRRIDLETGKTTILEKEGLANTDELVSDGDWIYATTWAEGGKLVRIAKDGSGTQVLADNLAAPYSIAVDDDAVYVSVRDQNKIMRFEKKSIVPL